MALAPPRTLRARLIAGLLALLVLTLAGVGLTVTGALQHFLLARLDQQLAETGGRYAASLEHLAPAPAATASSASSSTAPATPGPSTGESPRAAPRDTRAQAPGTVAAPLLGGTGTNAGVAVGLLRVVDGDADDDAVAAGTTPADTDDLVRLTPADQRALAALPVGGAARTVVLSQLGDYRVRAMAGADHDVLVTGLPLRQLRDTEHQMMVIELTVFAAAVTVAGVTGALWVRLALRPLARITDTAERVSVLPLARGAVVLSDRVPDADPATETGRVGLALNRMLGHVEEALGQRHAVEDRLRSFAADAGHELRTPVATVRGHAELALRHPDPIAPPVRHALERIEAESRRMGSIVDDLLLLARLDAGRPLAATEVDLTRLVLDCTADARAAGPGHHWRLDLPAEPLLVTGDEDRLRQVLANLLGNAHRHTPPGTTVTVRLAPAPDGAPGTHLTVTDDGPGITPDLAPHVFDRFVRGDPTRTRTTGSTGLGLAIAHAITTAHAGTLTLAHPPGHGTVFLLTLP
ncbi:hypothetical protein GCM10009665_03950 [Kitasatospora nipponensis]|uniref:histidine kinase n=1 Tax=Kitasatospora nipponensis TaxID=258049 RepID=A0ABN1VRX0_9ACTN